MFTCINYSIFLKQSSELKKVETALFDVAISNTMSEYNTYSLEETFNVITQKKQLNIYHNGSSIVERELQKFFFTYRELHQYYGVLHGVDDQAGNYLQEIIQDSEIFFNSLVKYYKHESFKANDGEDLYLISLKDEAYEGSEIISAIIKDLENIRSEVYEDNALENGEKWQEIVIKNEEYAQSVKAQQGLERIQQLIKMWSK
ncbi:hypothetical protein HMI01_20320 [Halolactibacillus miurensis]|uniref:Uncharacterized protein n=1 Tax=Halolactibacillus miurensis TaxID=306541 RepID=A0A1I6U9T2_9BACI|nr:hypothetical protein [Halolactibacillus miurensis]GEM05044.1 hypothetical protein HMI01_20320 [Halolactibacillus miurensis]SFS98037.1 hypothetical protein SAMN05421668_12334 [Halolactibacillus miurensis]